LEIIIKRLCHPGYHFLFYCNASVLLFYAQLAAELSIPYFFIMVDIFTGRKQCFIRNINNGEFSKYQSGIDEPGEEFENRIVSH